MSTLTVMDPVTGSAAFRKNISTGLTKALGRKWSIFPDGKPNQTITKPTVLLQRTSVTRVPRVANSQTTSLYSIILICDQTISETREDYLDGLFDQLADALEDLGLPFTQSERAEWNGTNPCYTFTIIANTHRLGATS